MRRYGSGQSLKSGSLTRNQSLLQHSTDSLAPAIKTIDYQPFSTPGQEKSKLKLIPILGSHEKEPFNY